VRSQIQKATQMTARPSRRHLVTTAAALAAGATVNLGAIALTRAADGPNLDAELLALGARLEPLLLDYMRNALIWAPASRAAHAEIGGLSEEWHNFTDEQQCAHIDALQAALERHGAEAASDRNGELAADIEPLVEQILEAPASSLAGLRAKALVVLWEARPALHDHSWLDFHEDDDGGACRSLFDAVADLTGIAPMVRSIEAQLAADAPHDDAAVLS
jgi:hypothetical protein